jgi:hypothetical protein
LDRRPAIQMRRKMAKRSGATILSGAAVLKLENLFMPTDRERSSE